MTTLIDFSRLKKEFSGDEDILIDLRDVFIAELPKMLAHIDQAITVSDPQRLEASAHILKGAIANFQSPQLRDAAFVLEQQGREKKLDQSREALNQLSKLMERFLIELKSVGIKAA